MATEHVQPAEIVVSHAWHEGRFGDQFLTTGQRTVRIIHRGTWSHGSGPDFQDAMVEFDELTLATGSIEIHTQSSGWTQHRHHLDTAYNDVILHLVLRHDGQETRRQDGALVPIVELGDDAISWPLSLTSGDWSRFGGAVCAEDLARHRPQAVRSLLWQLGDRRLAMKSARIEARLTHLPPGDVLFQELWDGLGYAANRVTMRAVAERLPLATLEAMLATVVTAERLALAQALLFGVAGFLPFAPADQAAAMISLDAAMHIESCWRERGTAWHEMILSPTAWTRAHVRPANQPARRLSGGASMLASAQSGLISALLEPLRRNTDLVTELRTLATRDGITFLGNDRAIGLVGNVIIPFALALAEHTNDVDLSVAAAACWERLPTAESNAVTRRAQQQVAGNIRLGAIGSRGQQGLIHLDQTLCSPRRCYECPIAQRVLSEDDALGVRR